MAIQQTNQPQAPDDGFNAILGPLPAQPINPAASSFADKIAAIGKTPAPVAPAAPAANGGNSFVNGILQPVKNLAGEIAAGSNQGQEIQQGIEKSNASASSGDYSYLKQINQKLQDSVKSGDSANAARYKNILSNFEFTDGTKMADIFPNINDTPEQVIGNAIGTGLLAMSGGGLEGGAEAVEGAAKGTQTFAQALKQGATIGGTFGAIGSGSSAMGKNSNAGDVVKSTAIGGLEGAAAGAGTAGLVHGAIGLPGFISDATQTAKNAANDTGDAVSNLVKGKPQAEILATPSDQVYKLNPSDRKAWFDNEQSKISSQSDTATQQAKDSLKTQGEATAQKAEDLKTQLATASRDKVIELRPKIVQAMGEQSKVYRSLVDEEMAGKEDTPVNIGDLKSFVETRFADNPGQLAAVKDRLGLAEVPETVGKGQLPTIQSSEGTKTLGELYSQTKSLRQDISAGAAKGTKTFTADDKLTDDSIHTITDFMKTKGVDFSDANKFWSKYAPIRNQLVTEAKPFLQTGTQTKTFANTLMRVAKGTDVNNENFINQVEDLLGKPINDENKGIVQQMTENEKTALANKMAAEEKITNAEMAKDKALKNLSDKQFEVERQARLRTVLRRILTVGAGFGVDKTIKHYTGIGF